MILKWHESLHNTRRWWRENQLLNNFHSPFTHYGRRWRSNNWISIGLVTSVDLIHIVIGPHFMSSPYTVVCGSRFQLIRLKFRFVGRGEVQVYFSVFTV